MKRFIHQAVLAGGCLFFAAASTIAAPTNGAGYFGGQVNPTRVSGHFQGNGGEFRHVSTGSGLLLPTSHYSPKTSGVSGNSRYFDSFCIELSENTGNPMSFWVSEAAANGSAGSHAWSGGVGGQEPGGGDNISPKTAYLYTKFALGTLNYAFTGTISVDPDGPGGLAPVNLNRAQSAGTLQQVIWFLENEVNALTSNAGGINLNAAQLALANAWLNEATAAGWTGIGNVRALQAYSGNTNRQDQLYLVIPVPAAAMLGLLGAGLTAALKRRMA